MSPRGPARPTSTRSSGGRSPGHSSAGYSPARRSSAGYTATGRSLVTRSAGAPGRSGTRAPSRASGGGAVRGKTAPAAARPVRRPARVSDAQARFAARIRRQRRRRTGMVVAAVASGLGLGWLVFASPLLAVHDVEVRGLHRLPESEVEALAAAQVGRAMALASPETVVARVSALPLVRSVRVERSWPDTLVVTVTEREPIAGVPAGKKVALVDGDGVVVETVARVPAGVPLLEVDVPRAGAVTLRAAREVADDIPVTMRAGVRSVRASSPDAVSFTLADGTVVVWGSAQDGDRKAAALLAVRPRRMGPRVVIDVSAPDAPAVTGA